MVELQDKFQNHSVEGSCLPVSNTHVKLVSKILKSHIMRPSHVMSCFVLELIYWTNITIRELVWLSLVFFPQKIEALL